MSPNYVVIQTVNVDGVLIDLTVPSDVIEAAKSGLNVEGVVGFHVHAHPVDPEAAR